MSCGCHVTVNVLWLFLAMTWAGVQCVIVDSLIILTLCKGGAYSLYLTNPYNIANLANV